MGWRFHARKTIRLWPFYAVFTERGFSSWGIWVGRFRHNLTRDTTSIDTPGWGGLSHRWRRR